MANYLSNNPENCVNANHHSAADTSMLSSIVLELG